MEDYASYPADFSVLRETVNLRALALYVRLIDLLDFAQDRTPYVIWKFVAPRNDTSKMEWAKHRALQPITTASYQQLSRTLVVDGSTDDHEVYAAIEDLAIYVDEQFRGCMDMLARMNDPRHQLDLHHVDWRVSARGFSPVSIRFDFDREKMFEILSDEIYRGDRYVFLRELLQNSIDAIRFRRAILERRGIRAENLGRIEVRVEYGGNGNAVVTWTDDGCGMDEYVVRSYLACAGKSYYRSAEFERHGLNLDPISRFGVGILSCFMVANRVEIETYREPYLGQSSQPLRIGIPSVEKQFRVETMTPETAEVGTTVRVFVESTGSISEADERPEPLQVTRYLKSIAGFVEFPIAVTERGVTTIILHPDSDDPSADWRLAQGAVISRLQLNYPAAERLVPQDIEDAKEILIEHQFYPDRDLELPDYHGSISYLAPKDGYDLTKFEYWENILQTPNHQPARSYRIRPKSPENVPSLSRSAGGTLNSSKIYRDGILLAEETVGSPQGYDDDLPPPVFLINLPKPAVPRVDLARTRVLTSGRRWQETLVNALSNRILDDSIRQLLDIEPAQRLYQMGRLLVFHPTNSTAMWAKFPTDRWPVPLHSADGNFVVSELGEPIIDVMYSTPAALNDFQHSFARKHLVGHPDPVELSKWDGEDFFFGACRDESSWRG